MANNGKDAKHTRHISRRMHFVGNGEDFNLHRIVWYEGGLKLVDIVTNNVRKYELNPRLINAMVRLDNWQNTCAGGVIRDSIFQITRYSNESTGLSWDGLDSMSFKCSIILKWWK